MTQPSSIGFLTENELAQLTYAVARVVPLTEAQRDAVNAELRREMEIETGKRLDTHELPKADNRFRKVRK